MYHQILSTIAVDCSDTRAQVYIVFILYLYCIYFVFIFYLYCIYIVEGDGITTLGRRFVSSYVLHDLWSALSGIRLGN